jgi:hypothetical protein
MASIVQIKQQLDNEVMPAIRDIVSFDKRITALERCLGSDRLDMLHDECASLVNAVSLLDKRLGEMEKQIEASLKPVDEVEFKKKIEKAMEGLGKD